ncbi:hypothetical protein TVAG_495680 [Trichomonas vaginalis G3]|uniref:Major facilitator superfamily (MFS) profile domain-containing protein n=1 Tax=Trichomonas vaginalis (strain ATCC PRA-98 / G3) TaxID=412133 RepID=A2DVK9_TRIV3|nr:glucose import [Trichomonas vaginalis G3]EAY15551.1 hypothetical protein TVAG_495680 [Trichomonas vaginalis G3]KAI5526197.1 glucose import [Trichomonas vaginalis G3]|eukprot:XP_001327774.1 hypothetical protein [Trichomonas vaginalis G3]
MTGTLFGLGLAPMPWYCSPERFTLAVRPMASSINGMTSWLFSFIIVYASPAMTKSKIGSLGTFLFYGIVVIAGTIFGFFVIHEPDTVEALDHDSDPNSDQKDDADAKDLDNEKTTDKVDEKAEENVNAEA